MSQPKKNPSSSWLDESEVFDFTIKLIREGNTNASIVAELNKKYNRPCSEASLRRFRKRHNINPDGVQQAYTKIDGDEAEAVTAPTPQILDDPDTMLRERGLTPEDWVITHLTANEYQGPNSSDAVKAGGSAKITYYQTKFSVSRKNGGEPIMAPRTDGWIAPPRPPLNYDNTRLVVIVGDQQAPFHDVGLHNAFCSWLRVNLPQQGISLGDTYDFGDIRPGHRVYPEHNAEVTECLQAGYDIFRGYINASALTRWTKLIGNHDERLTGILLDKPSVKHYAEIRRPVRPDGTGGEKLHAIEHAGRLDELGIEVIETGGSYEHGQVNLSKHLAVRHGWIARKGSGASALGSLEALRYSVVVGHTHRQSIVHQTSASIDGHINTLSAAEAGCMCRVEQIPDPEDGRMWPGYLVTPDWQQGFMTATIWPDGKFRLDAATYVDGTLLWRDQRYDSD